MRNAVRRWAGMDGGLFWRILRGRGECNQERDAIISKNVYKEHL